MTESTPIKTTQQDQKWPLSSLVALAALGLVALLTFAGLRLNQQMLEQVENTVKTNQQTQLASQQAFEAALKAMEKQLQQQTLFITKQQHYSQLMALLADVFVLTERLDAAALQETLHQARKHKFALEPFLNTEEKQWLTQQYKSIAKLSTELSDPLQEYEENLLATKTSLRNLIDETHKGLYPMLFSGDAGVQEDAKNAP